MGEMPRNSLRKQEEFTAKKYPKLRVDFLGYCKKWEKCQETGRK
jgi:hypothetical protein